MPTLPSYGQYVRIVLSESDEVPTIKEYCDLYGLSFDLVILNLEDSWNEI